LCDSSLRGKECGNWPLGKAKRILNRFEENIFDSINFSANFLFIVYFDLKFAVRDDKKRKKEKINFCLRRIYIEKAFLMSKSKK
jgi:hypothetical protein